MKNLFEKILILLGALCLLYYLLCGLFDSFGLSILYIWVIAGVSLILLGVLHIFVKRKFPRMKMIPLIKIPLIGIISLVLIFFFAIEGFVLSGIFSSYDGDLDYVMILGAKVNGTQPSKALYFRIETAYEYLSAHEKTVAIASGGKGDDEEISEGDCIANELEKMGIDRNRILIERESTTTVENIQNSIALIDAEQAKIGIVSNNFHVARSALTGNCLSDFEFFPIAAPYPDISIVHYTVREFATIVFDLKDGHIRFF